MKRPSFATAAFRVFDISVGQMLWSRRTVFMALTVGAPVAIAIVLRTIHEMGMPVLRVNGAPVSGEVIFGGLFWLLYLRFVVPVLGAFYGTSLMSDEVEDRTLTYLFTRPVPRGAVIIGKYLAYLVCTELVVLPSVTAAYFLITPLGGGSIGAAFPVLLTDLGILAIGLVAYGAVFALIGALVPRPLVAGLLLVFGWEQIALLVPGYLRRFTVAHYLQSLAPQAMPQNDTMAAIQSLFAEPPSAASSLISLAGITLVALWLAARTVERRDYVLDQ
ncbi:MAG TPA: ABC transporter permease subunit [Vicinamibacterales bacterium]|nr:ABC transporter permease subunit [Vicinamibacterales bacterium]